MWGMILSGVRALTGLGEAITTISAAIADARIAAINAKTQEERIAAEERVKILQLRRDVLIGEASVSKANIFMRTLIAAPVAILFWKIFVFDKALGQWTGGSTEQLSPELWQVITVVTGFYFLYEGAVGVARLLSR
jgi:hypothetical protein